MAVTEPVPGEISADTLVVGGGPAGMTAGVELAEIDRQVILVERQPSLGGRVAASFQYFPKLCPPICGIEINLKRIRTNPNIRVLTLAEVEDVTGDAGDYTVRIKLTPRYVNDKCTACGECAKVCEIERDNDFNYGLDKTKAIYLPHLMAYPFRYVIDPKYVGDERLKKCVDVCAYAAIELDMKPQTVTAKVKAVVWATGWKPYDAAKIDNLGFGRVPNVITNVMMERLAAPNGPTEGRICRPSDNKEISRVGFVQCAGSRDENHLPYCSSICCMASMKQATYVRSQYPDADVHMFYIDVRSPGRWEDFYVKMQDDQKMHFHRGKVAKIEVNPETGNPVLHAENTLTGQITETEVDLAVLATGMVPTTAEEPPPLETPRDEFGFIVEEGAGGLIGAGTVVRPVDVAASVQGGTGAAMKAIIVGTRR